MGVEAVEMDLEDGKLRNNIKLISIEKSLDELLTSGKGNTGVYIISTRCSSELFAIVIALRWV